MSTVSRMGKWETPGWWSLCSHYTPWPPSCIIIDLLFTQRFSSASHGKGWSITSSKQRNTRHLGVRCVHSQSALWIQEVMAQVPGQSENKGDQWACSWDSSSVLDRRVSDLSRDCRCVIQREGECLSNQKSLSYLEYNRIGQAIKWDSSPKTN